MAAEVISTAKPKQRRKSVLIPLVLVFLGVLILLYPVFSTNYNNYKQRQFAEQYNSAVQELNADVVNAELKEAREYNAKLPGIPILDPWLDKVSADPGSVSYKDYSEQLNATDSMARVRVPSVNISLPVYHDTTPDVIAKGAGHLYGTSLPVGGVDTHAVLTSHTGMSNATLFDNLSKVVEGDLIFIDVYGETLAYKVDQIKVVLPNEIADLQTVRGKDYLTLFTCTPYAVNSHRLLVRGERVDWTPEVAEDAKTEQSAFVIQSWMWWLLGAAVLGLLALIAMIVRERRRRKRNEERKALVAAEPAPSASPVNDQRRGRHLRLDSPDEDSDDSGKASSRVKPN